MRGIPEAAVRAVVEAGRRLAEQGWVPATAGNLSVRLEGGRVAITRSGFHKAYLTAEAVMAMDPEGRPENPALRPSAETGLHLGAYRRFPEAGAVVHGHSVANTVLSRRAGDAIRLQGYELLKVFPGLPTHDAAVDVPVFDNDQDIGRLQRAVAARWDGMAARGESIPPGYVIRGHGAYVWAPDMEAALARLEGLEFMLACELAGGGFPLGIRS